MYKGIGVRFADFISISHENEIIHLDIMAKK